MELYLDFSLQVHVAFEMMCVMLSNANLYPIAILLANLALSLWTETVFGAFINSSMAIIFTGRRITFASLLLEIGCCMFIQASLASGVV